jgi:DNA repair protein RadC
LHDAELLAVLLGTGIRGRRVDQLAQGLLKESGGLRALLREEPVELARRPGIGPARAAQVAAALELGRRAQHPGEPRPRLHTAGDVYRYLAPTLAALRREVFHVLCLSPRNVLLKDVRVAEGTVNVCPVDPREVFAPALAARATALVVAHNHPSGDPEPSSHDIALTRQLSEGAAILGMQLLDHVVVGDGAYVSLLERRLISPEVRRGTKPKEGCRRTSNNAEDAAHVGAPPTP